MRKKCCWCGKAFVPIHHFSKYCSTECIRLSRNKREYTRRSVHHEETLQYQRAYYKRTYIRKSYPAKPCLVCGTIFEPVHHCTKFCSSNCIRIRNCDRVKLARSTNEGRAQGRQYYLQNRERISTRSKLHRRANKQLLADRARLFYLRNPHKRKEYQDKWNQKQPSERFKHYARKSYEQNRDKVLKKGDQLRAAGRLVNSLQQTGVANLTSGSAKHVYKSTPKQREKERQRYLHKKDRISQTTKTKARERSNRKYHENKAALKLVRELEKNSIGALLP